MWLEVSTVKAFLVALESQLAASLRLEAVAGEGFKIDVATDKSIVVLTIQS